MSDSNLHLLLKRLMAVEQSCLGAGCPTHKLTREIIDWLCKDRSMLQHRCCQAYMTYLFQSYGDDFKTREDYTDWLKLQTGFCKRKETIATIENERVKFIKYKPMSLSFSSCSQKKHQAFFDALKQYALDAYGVNFDDWYSEYQKNENTLQ